jgi:hypothetical protein
MSGPRREGAGIVPAAVNQPSLLANALVSPSRHAQLHRRRTPRHTALAGAGSSGGGSWTSPDQENH